MSYSCKHWFKRLSKSKLSIWGGGIWRWKLLSHSKSKWIRLFGAFKGRMGLKVKKNMLLGGRSEGNLLLHKDNWIIHSGFVFQSPVFIDWRCSKFALIHSKLLWLKKRFVWAKIKRVKVFSYAYVHCFQN